MLQQANNNFESELVQEKERILFMHAPVANTTIMIMAFVVFFVFNNRVDFLYLSLWVLFVLLSVGLRMFIWIAHRFKHEMQSTQQWIFIYSTFTGLLGLVFGLCYLFSFQNQDFVVNFSLSMFFFGIISAAGYVLSCHMPIFIVYTYPPAMIFAGAQIAHQTLSHTLIGLSILLYMVMLTLFTRIANRQFLTKVRLQFDNEKLIVNLNHEVDQRELIIRQRTGELVKSNIELKRTEEQLKRNEISLHHLAHHDTLTELPNRLLLIDRLNHSINKAERADMGLALMFIDVDNFKEINDSLGHSVGDELLQAVAERLNMSLRKEDTAARLGGDEFTIILEELDDDKFASTVAEKLLNSFKQPIKLKDREITITISIGISIFPGHGTDTETLLRNADSAMYRTKNEGRNGFRIYSEDLTERAIARLAIESDLRSALTDDQFQLHFQPQVCMSSGRIVGVEALIRWLHPKEGLLYPDRFISLAEEIGLIDEIGLWVIQSCCQNQVKWKQAGFADLHMAINISGRQLVDEHFADKMRNVIQDTGCDPGCIELEITEGYLIQHPDKTAMQCNDLRQLGVSIAIDDFGTGYSSLTYLKQFPISKLKIDYSFIRDILDDPNDQAITRAIIALGKSLDLTVIAEGVENEEQKKFLQAEGCDLAQGYYFSRPLPEKVLLDYLQKSFSLSTSG